MIPPPPRLIYNYCTAPYRRDRKSNLTPLLFADIGHRYEQAMLIAF